MDQLAREGILFERAYAPSSWTLPSVASLFLGQRASEHQVLQFMLKLPTRSPTLAEVLAGNGYVTAAFVANTAIVRAMGYERGFSEFALLESPELATSILAYLEASEVNARVFAWLDGRASADRPVFLYLHYMDPHPPYRSHAGFTMPRQAGVTLSDDDLAMRSVMGSRVEDAAQRRTFWGVSSQELRRIGDLYDGGVSYVDHQLGLLLAGLEARGVLEDAVVVLTSDHGEELGEHGLFGHGMTLFEPEIRVPLILKLRGGPRAARVVRPVETAGIAATLLRELDIPVPPGFTTPHLPLPDRADHPPEAVVSEMEPIRKVAVGLHRRVRLEGTRKAFKATDGKRLLTDLATDPAEQALHAPATADQLRLVKALDAVEPGSEPVRSPAATSIDADTRRRLDALGYVLPDGPAPTPGS
jgi:arylsulfatase A-like enzyme